MSPIPDYDLGRAHGRIVIDYDNRGTDAAQEDLQGVEEQADQLGRMLEKLRKFFRVFTGDITENISRIAAAFSSLTGGAAILTSMTSATRGLNSGIMRLRGGLGILGALNLLFGQLPGSVQGFPKIIKNIIRLSAALTLLHQSTRLLSFITRKFMPVIANSFAGKWLTDAIRKVPLLQDALKKLGSVIPGIRSIGDAINGLGAPIHRVARAALTLGALISFFRTGMRLATKLTKSILAMGAAASVIQLLVFLTTGLIDAMKELSGVLGLIPGLLATAGLAAATFKVGMTGIKDAMKNLNAEQSKFDESIKNLAPSAQNAMRALRGLRDEWASLTRSVQQQLFSGVADQINDLATIYLPLLRRQMSLVADELNNWGDQLVAFAKRGETISGVNRLFETTRQILRNLSHAIQPLLQAFLDIAIVSSEVLADLTRGAGNAAEEFANFIRTARETGQLRQWIEDGVDAVEKLIAIVVQLGQIFDVVFDAFDTSGEGFLQALSNMTYSMLRFLKSFEGQQALNTVVELLETLSSATRAVLGAGFRELGPILRALMPLIKEMAETFSGVLVAAIEILGPIIRGFAEALSFLAPVLGPILGFMLALKIAGAALGVGFSILSSLVGLLVGAFNLMVGVLKVLKWLAVGHPILLLITLLATAAVLIIQNWEKVGPVLKGIWEWIANIATTVFTAVRDFFVSIWNEITDFLIGIWNTVTEALATAWNGTLDFFINLWNDVSGFFITIWTEISNFLTGIWNAIVENTRFIWEPLVGIITGVFRIAYEIVRTTVLLIAFILYHTWNAILVAAKAVWDAILWVLEGAWNIIMTVFHAIWDPLVEFFTWLWNTITTAISEAWTYITEWLTLAWQTILQVWHSIWDPLVEFFKNLWDGITNKIRQAWDAIKNFFSGIWTRITDDWKRAWNHISNWFRDIWNSGVVRAVRDGVGAVVDWIKSLPGKIWNFVKDAGRWLIDAGKAVIEGFLNGLKDAFHAVADWIGGIGDWIAAHKGPLDYDRRLLIPAGEAIMEGLLGGLQSKEAVILDFLQRLTGDIQDGMGSANNLLTDTAGIIASSANVGIVTSGPTNAAAVASSPTPIGTVANGVPVPAGGDGATTPAPIQIGTLELKVAGNLDPTNPVEFKQTIKRIKDGIREVERDNQ